MKAVIYARVSTDMQDASNQIDVLRDWSQHRGYELGEVYQEAETAWKNGHQKELYRLIDNARRHRFDMVLVWSLDRLSREGSLAILQLVKHLYEYHVQVLSYQEPWTEAPGELGELLYALAGWVARMESQRRSERTKAGIQRYRREHKGKWGRPKLKQSKN